MGSRELHAAAWLDPPENSTSIVNARRNPVDVAPLVRWWSRALLVAGGERFLF